MASSWLDQRGWEQDYPASDGDGGKPQCRDLVGMRKRFTKQLDNLLLRHPDWPGGLPDPGQTGVKILDAVERQVWAELLAERCLKPIEGGPR